MIHFLIRSQQLFCLSLPSSVLSMGDAWWLVIHQTVMICEALSGSLQLLTTFSWWRLWERLMIQTTAQRIKKIWTYYVISLLHTHTFWLLPVDFISIILGGKRSQRFPEWKIYKYSLKIWKCDICELQGGWWTPLLCLHTHVIKAHIGIMRAYVLYKWP